jgi:predicted DNA-binding transcriptional regulator AlpA
MSDPAKSALDSLLDLFRAVVREEIAAAVKGSKDDRLLDIDEVCKILNVAKPWVYHNVKKLPFVRKVGGNLRFSSNGLQKWIQDQRLRAAKDGG